MVRSINRLIIVVVALFMSLSSFAQTEDQLFLDGKKAANKGQWEEVLAIHQEIKDHPLAPYLEYYYIRRHLGSLEDGVINNFLDQYPNSPMAAKLRKKWLENLFKAKQWDHYLSVYKPSTSLSVQCDYLTVLKNTGKSNEAFEQVKPLWLNNNEHPDNCKMIFNAWLAQLKNKNEIVWQRFEMALLAKNMTLAKKMGVLLSGSKKTEAKQIIRLFSNHNLVLNKSFLNAKPSAEVISYGVMRKARSSPAAAINAWKKLSQTYQFTPEQEQRMFAQIGLTMTMRKNSNAPKWYRKALGAQLNDVHHEWMVRSGLLFDDWDLVVKSIDSMDPDNRTKAQWQYWYARALNELGQTKKADKIFDELDEQRNYHGFLASQYTDDDVSVNHNPLPMNELEVNAVKNLPGLKRAKKLYQLQQTGMATSELYYLVKHLPVKEQYIVTKLVSDWGWHVQALRLSSFAEHKDDITIRFPLSHQETIDKHAKKRKLNPALIFALIRQESFFTPYVISHAGAVGLMQLMPATAKRTARKFSVSYDGQSALKDSKKNIQLGSAHLRELHSDLKNHPVLVVAAYNAGKKAVRRWLPKGDAIDADVWIETVPYHETRNYLKNVIAYYIVYQHRLGQPPKLDQILRDIPTIKK